MNHMDLIQKVKSCEGKYTKTVLNKTKKGTQKVQYCSIIPYKFRKNPMICPYQTSTFGLKVKVKGKAEESIMVYKCVYIDPRYVNREVYDPIEYSNIK